MTTQRKVLVVHAVRPKSAAAFSNLSKSGPESGKYLRIYSAASERSRRHLSARSLTPSSSQAPSDGENSPDEQPETTVWINYDGKIVCIGMKMGRPKRLNMKNIKIYTVSKHHKAKQITAVLGGKSFSKLKTSRR